MGYDGQLFGTQQVVEYQETTRSHLALTYDHADAIGTWAPSALPATAGRAGAAAAGAAAPTEARKLDKSMVPKGEEYARMAG